MENENKKSKKGIGLAIIAIIIIAIIAGVAYYFLRPVSPKDVFISQINATIEKANIANSSKEKVNSTISLSGNIETTNKELAQVAQIIKEGKLTLNVQTDTNTKKVLVGADVNYQNQSLLNAKVFYQKGDNNAYLYVKDLFDKYFKVNIGEMQDEEEVTAMVNGIKDAKTSSKILEETLAQNLKEEFFSKEDVDGKTKYTMKLSENELKETFTNIVTSLKNNQNYLNCFEEPDKVKESFEEVVNSIKEIEDDNKISNIEISIYTKGSSKEIEDVTFKVKDIEGKINVEKVDSNTSKATITVENVPEIGKVTLNMEIKNSNDTDLDSVDTSNSVEFDKMSQTEMMKLYTNLTKMKIYPYIAPLFNFQ